MPLAALRDDGFQPYGASMGAFRKYLTFLGRRTHFQKSAARRRQQFGSNCILNEM